MEATTMLIVARAVIFGLQKKKRRVIGLSACGLARAYLPAYGIIWVCFLKTLSQAYLIPMIGAWVSYTGLGYFI